MFSKASINVTEPNHYWFEASMISTCKPVFKDCSSNYDVESALRKAKVIRKNNRTDTESSALVVLFASRKAGEAFIDRLNNYLSTH